jgi:hypothetical protein
MSSPRAATSEHSRVPPVSRNLPDSEPGERETEGGSTGEKGRDGLFQVLEALPLLHASVQFEHLSRLSDLTPHRNERIIGWQATPKEQKRDKQKQSVPGL